MVGLCCVDVVTIVYARVIVHLYFPHLVTFFSKYTVVSLILNHRKFEPWDLSYRDFGMIIVTVEVGRKR